MTGSFKMYTIFIDEKNDDGELMIDDLINSHLNFFSSLNTSFIENCDADAYYYYRNMSSSNQSSYISQLEALGDTIGAREEEEAEGFVAPTTYLVDGGTVDPDYVIYEQITQCLFNYTTDVEGSTDFNKAYFLRDCWHYKGVFSRDYKPKN